MKASSLCCVVLCCVVSIFFLVSNRDACGQGMYGISCDTIHKKKEIYDDPRPLVKDLSYDTLLPSETVQDLTYDIEAMKRLWSDLVGFKSPEITGNVAPEIIPGEYSCADKDKYPFKEIMIPTYYDRFNPGSPPFACNFSRIKVIPTRHYYWALPVSEASKKYQGQVKQDAAGYMDYSTYEAGFPFPRPSGEHKAMQIMYNWEKRYVNWESSYLLLEVKGFDADLREDFDSLMEMFAIRLDGRVTMEPFGWLDERAEANHESRAIINKCYSPRDLFGNAFSSLTYENPNKMHQCMMYLNVFRRVRTMSGTDTQDAMGGQDTIYEDGDGFNQKITTKRYPYTYEVIAEREYLVPAYTLDGSGYLSSKGRELHDYEFERRPVYVLKLTQMDKDFVYSYRILYFDKETFTLLLAENYDQRGRLYRDYAIRNVFHPTMGMFSLSDIVSRDKVDVHSTYQRGFVVPAPGIGRDDVSIRNMIKSR